MTKNQLIAEFEGMMRTQYSSYNDGFNFAVGLMLGRLKQLAVEPSCDHEWRFLGGALDSTGQHYTDKCAKCGTSRQRHIPL